MQKCSSELELRVFVLAVSFLIVFGSVSLIKKWR